MKGSNYCMYLDISGTLKKTEDDIYVGCIIFNDNYRTDFKDKFYREFPSLKHFDVKGTNIAPAKVKEVISFMNSNKIRMSIVVLQRYMIKKIESRIKAKLKELKKSKEEVHIRFFPERVMGLAYFAALTAHAYKNYQYDCRFCMESQYQIQESFVVISRLCHMKKYNFRTSCTPRRTEHMIKFADFCASAGKKLDKYVLDSFENVKYIKFEPTDEDLNIAFCLNRREKTYTVGKEKQVVLDEDISNFQ
jgi:hypothetical protein